uniref:Uncharacterized protein n=1 Tax=Macrostomum lignano TaxID=282301 RepID=A0A1I8HGQ8_9PLAT
MFDDTGIVLKLPELRQQADDEGEENHAEVGEVAVSAAPIAASESGVTAAHNSNYSGGAAGSPTPKLANA